METWIPYVVIVVAFIIAAIWMTIKHHRNMRAIRKILDDM